MGTELRSFDFRFIVRELRASLLGGKFRKIYQYGPGQKSFLFDVYVSTKGNFWLYSDAEKLFLAQHKKDAPETPPNFCMLLRKYLLGSTIKDIRQHGFDRVIEIITDSNVIIFEFVPPGNIILCDRFYNVIMPLQGQRWKDREVLPKRPYVYPPESMNPYNISLETFGNMVRKRQESVDSLTAKMGFGSLYANEICHLAGLDGKKHSNELSTEEMSRLYTVVRNLGGMKTQPVTYDDGTVSLFPLQTKKEGIKARWSSLSAPLDEASMKEHVEKVEKEQEKVVDEKKGEIERIIKQQEKTVEKMKEKRSEDKEKADTIYRFYGLVDDILNGIRMARDGGLGWDEIKRRVQSEQTPEADAILEIKEHDGIVVVEIGSKQIELDFTKSVEDNAASYYEDSKDARRRYEGAEVAMEGKKAEMGMIASLPETDKPVIKPKKPRKPRRKWYERFRWFISSKKFLIVAGKDAATNENLIKKHTDDRDWVLHTDIQGSAFVVVKTKSPRGTKFAGLSEGGMLPPEVLKEASEMAAACSKAWSKGLGNIDVYAVKPNQVSKTPPTGASLPKGSFMIYGERKWFKDVEVKMAIGVLIDLGLQKAEAIAGPVMALRTFTKYFVTIKPGDTPATELAKKIKDALIYKANPEYRPLIEQINTDDFQKLIPSSSGMLVVSI